MLGNRKLILDDHSELYRELLPWADAEFWDIAQQQILPGSVVVVCREQVNRRGQEIKALAESGLATVVVDNAAEGSETLVTWCWTMGLVDLVQQGKILLIGGGDMDASKWPYMSYEYFLPKIFDFDENVETGQRMDEYFSKTVKPYKFLFLNGRLRSHRKYLLERFRLSGLLEQSLWTNLDSNLTLVQHLPQSRWADFNNIDTVRISLMHNGQDLMDQAMPVQYLPVEYEFPAFKAQVGQTPDASGFVKKQLFDNTWGDALVSGHAYCDTYFSLVTETVFNYPYSFRTEKIWKPIAIGHPWIVAANRGFYKDIRRMGFKTFSHVVDESFDDIDNNQERIERIAQIVEDLCQQDLVSFYKECYNVCKYNQQHYAEYRHRVPRELPEQFQRFIEKYQ